MSANESAIKVLQLRVSCKAATRKSDESWLHFAANASKSWMFQLGDVQQARKWRKSRMRRRSVEFCPSASYLLTEAAHLHRIPTPPAESSPSVWFSVTFLSVALQMTSARTLKSELFPPAVQPLCHFCSRPDTVQPCSCCSLQLRLRLLSGCDRSPRSAPGF